MRTPGSTGLALRVGAATLLALPGWAAAQSPAAETEALRLEHA